MIAVHRLPFALTAIIVLLSINFSTVVMGSPSSFKDLHPECGEWAKRGDCEPYPRGRPYFMQANCPESCHKKMTVEPERRRLSDDDRDEFYELSAKEATGKVLPMENFEGYVTLLVNAARVCEYSDIFYGSLEQIHSINPHALEILAFPFDHPNIDTDSCRDAIRSEEKKAGMKIHIMEAIEINGPGTHPVYKYLKALFDIEELDPNAAHYFFIDPDVTMIEHHHGSSYKMLEIVVKGYLHHFLGDNAKGNPRRGEL